MKRRIRLSKLEKDCVIIEPGKEFEDSLFSGIYNRVEELLISIIQKNSNNDFDHTEIDHIEIDNIISFEGRRGTGKTSVMRSVHEALKEKDDWKFLKRSELKDSSFHVIDYIDASTLERGEDILEIILANMFSEIKKLDTKYLQEYNDNERRELYRQFDEIYGNLIEIKNYHMRNTELSPLALLNQLSNSQILKTKIRKLVKSYLVYIKKMTSRNERAEKNFLVISVDDIDMHFQNQGSSAFDMLETLHRYFMIPGVIIMLTYDYSHLHLGCEKHFEHIYPEYQIRETGINPRHTRELSTQYLKKILPINSRIHMPSLKKSDYSEDNPLTIQVETEKARELLGEFAHYLLADSNSQMLELDSKKFVMLLKASVADLYYDALGEKRHFIEATDLRDLAQIYVFYRNLIHLKQQSDDFEDKLFKEILDNLYFRFARMNLEFTEQDKFNKYLEVKLANRSQRIIDDIIEQSKEEVINSQIVYKSKTDQSYSYGELLYYLYEASRRKVLSKNMICCILDSYTTVMTKHYRKIKAGDQTGYQKILKVLGDSAVGGWSNRFLPPISIIKNPIEEDDDLDYQLFPWLEEYKSAGALSFDGNDVRWKIPLKSLCSRKKLKELLQLLEILSMFFTDVYHREYGEAMVEGLKFSYISPDKKIEEALDKKDDQTFEFEPYIMMEFHMGSFNIFNFVINLLNGAHFFESLHKNLQEAFEQYLAEVRISKDGRKVKEPVQLFIKNNSLKKEFECWKEDTSGFALPLYSMDMMYNIMKRQYEDNRLIPAYVESFDLIFYVKEVYKGIGKQLKQEDEFYFSNQKGITAEDGCRFYHAFKKCPFISWIEKLEEDSFLEEDFKSIFTQMILTLIQIE